MGRLWWLCKHCQNILGSSCAWPKPWRIISSPSLNPSQQLPGQVIATAVVEGSLEQTKWEAKYSWTHFNNYSPFILCNIQPGRDKGGCQGWPRGCSGPQRLKIDCSPWFAAEQLLLAPYTHLIRVSVSRIHILTLSSRAHSHQTPWILQCTRTLHFPAPLHLLKGFPK